MIMKKDMIRWGAALAVLLVLYILVVFLIPFVKTATFWVSFVFTLVAFGVVGAAFYIAFIKTPDAKSKFYGFPIAKIGAIYGMAQLVAGILFMALAAYVPAWVAVLIYAIASEKDSVLFYSEMQNLTQDERAKTVFGEIIRQERGHMFRLQRQLELLNKNAE